MVELVGEPGQVLGLEAVEVLAELGDTLSPVLVADALQLLYRVLEIRVGRREAGGHDRVTRVDQLTLRLAQHARARSFRPGDHGVRGRVAHLDAGRAQVTGDVLGVGAHPGEKVVDLKAPDQVRFAVIETVSDLLEPPGAWVADRARHVGGSANVEHGPGRVGVKQPDARGAQNVVELGERLDVRGRDFRFVERRRVVRRFARDAAVCAGEDANAAAMSPGVSTTVYVDGSSPSNVTRPSSMT